MKRIGYMVMVLVAAMAIAGCHCKDKCCGTCKSGKEAAKKACTSCDATKKACCGTCDKAKDAVKKACCGTCGGAKEAVKKACCGTCQAEKKVEAPATPAPEKPKDHPAH